jgi:ATP-dependent Lon protease
LNQKGISYKGLFGDYLRDAKRVVITDPFIRHPYQIDNFIELVQMIREVSAGSEEIDIELHTNNEESRIPEMIDIFDELADELASYGIGFKYYFDATHDRSIKTDTGWHITLGRGLDIFEPFGRFTLSNSRQENRRCREFDVTIVRG